MDAQCLSLSLTSGPGLGREHGPVPGLVAAWAIVLLVRQATDPAPGSGRREGCRRPQARLVRAWRRCRLWRTPAGDVICN
jgi:hypothetical protein